MSMCDSQASSSNHESVGLFPPLFQSAASATSISGTWQGADTLLRH